MRAVIVAAFVVAALFILIGLGRAWLARRNRRGDL